MAATNSPRWNISLPMTRSSSAEVVAAIPRRNARGNKGGRFFFLFQKDKSQLDFGRTGDLLLGGWHCAVRCQGVVLCLDLRDRAGDDILPDLQRHQAESRPLLRQHRCPLDLCSHQGDSQHPHRTVTIILAACTTVTMVIIIAIIITLSSYPSRHHQHHNHNNISTIYFEGDNRKGY